MLCSAANAGRVSEIGDESLFSSPLRAPRQRALRLGGGTLGSANLLLCSPLPARCPSFPSGHRQPALQPAPRSLQLGSGLGPPSGLGCHSGLQPAPAQSLRAGGLTQLWAWSGWEGSGRTAWPPRVLSSQTPLETAPTPAQGVTPRVTQSGGGG